MDTTRRKDFWRPKLIVVSVLALGSKPAWSLKVDYRVGTSILRSDNVGLVADLPDDDWVIAPSVDFTVSHAGSRFRLAGRGSAQYLKYVRNTFDSGPRGAMAIEANWVAMPDRLEFMVANHLTRRPIDSFVSYSPGNDQQINVLVAGPTVSARLNAVTHLKADLRFTHTTAQRTHELDGSAYSLIAGLEHAVSPTRTMGLSLESTARRFRKRSFANDYDLRSGFLRYGSRLRNTQLTLDVGYSQVSVASGSRSSGPLLRLSGVWTPRPRHVLRMRMSQEYADTSQNVIARSRLRQGGEPLIEGFMNAQGVVSPRVYLDRRASLGYDFTGERLRLSVDYERDWSTYLRSQRTGAAAFASSINVDYRLGRRLNGHAYAGAYQRQNDLAKGRDNNLMIGAGVAFRWTSHWNMRADLQYRMRRTPIHEQGFRENAVIFYFGYQP